MRTDKPRLTLYKMSRVRSESAHVHAHMQHLARLFFCFLLRELSNDRERRPDAQEDSCGDPHLDYCVCMCARVWDCICVHR